MSVITREKDSVGVNVELLSQDVDQLDRTSYQNF